MQNRNVIIFGETGAGKSSVINLLAGKEVAKVANTARGCTFQYTSYPIDICGSEYSVYDTSGLNEGDPHTINRTQAISQMYRLLISLKNWRLFHEVICAKEVPIVIVVTGLEDEECMDNWWFQNRDKFFAYGMTPEDYACITATKGKLKNGRHMFEEEYAESRDKVQRIIMTCALEKPWVVPKMQWLVETSVRCQRIKIVDKEVFPLLHKCTGSKEEVEELAHAALVEQCLC
ncbi:hypothetical protein F5I97DRAFT_1853337 [Phlebopus sp. FC_14]|nr:hypothetical protein F5I97DRAFT_1853337 [Phlebopus sp. FC_14]